MYGIYRVSVLGISKRNKDTLGSGVDWESCCSGKNGFRDLKIPCQYTFVWCPRLLQSQGEHTKNSWIPFYHDARTEGGFSRSWVCLFQVCLLLTPASVSLTLLGLFFLLLLIPWKGEWACVCFPDSWILNYLGWHSHWDSINYWGFQYFKICTILGWLFFWLITEETQIYGLELEHSFQSCSAYGRSVLP